MVSLETAEANMARRGKIAESLILLERPELVNLFLTYQNEAVAARRSLDNSLKRLDSRSEILEIGGGILALAIQLASEGFKVTTVEPVGEGFTGISYIMKITLEIARKEDLIIELIESPIEDCSFDSKFDFIFSINVMEHLKDPYSVLIQMMKNLNRGGHYRFFCPNYDFPYEPHFGKFLFFRSGNSFVLPRKRASHLSYTDSEGLFNSINWITVRKILRISKKNKYKIVFNRNALRDILLRTNKDKFIRQRHPISALLLKPIVFLNILKLASVIPVKFQPTIDVTLTNDLIN